MGSPQLELHVHLPKGFLAVLRMPRQAKSSEKIETKYTQYVWFLSANLPLLTQLQWIRKVLLAEEFIGDTKKQHFNFNRDDFRKITSSLWTCDCPVFLHGLLKIYILFALQVFLFTGARIGAFIPQHKHKKQRGLRYRVRYPGGRSAGHDTQLLTLHSTSSWFYFILPMNPG